MKNIHKLPFPSLLNEMVDYSKNKSLSIKAAKVYAMCIRKKKYDIAKRIKEKYLTKELEKSDFAIAFALGLQSVNQSHADNPDSDTNEESPTQ